MNAEKKYHVFTKKKLSKYHVESECVPLSELNAKKKCLRIEYHAIMSTNRMY